jgi:hypothetical protein
MDPRLEAYASLAMACAFVYGPKISAMAKRRRGENARNVTPKPNGADPSPPAELDFTQMTQGKFH